MRALKCFQKMTEYCGGNESSQLLTSITEADDGDKNEDEAEDLSNGASGKVVHGSLQN